MQLGTPELREWLSKRFKGHPIDLVVLVFYRLVGGVSQIVTGAVTVGASAFFGHGGSSVSRGATNVGWFLVGYGTLKCLTAAALWSRSHAARVAGLAVFCGIAAYAAFRLTHAFERFTTAALVVNLFFAWYFWKILPRYIPVREPVRADRQ